MDSRARSALDRAGYTTPGSTAAFANRAYLDKQDIVVVMTKEHRHDVLKRLTNPSTSVQLLRNLTGEERELDVPDPYYGDDDVFDACRDMIAAACAGLVDALARRFMEELGPSTVVATGGLSELIAPYAETVDHGVDGDRHPGCERPVHAHAVELRGVSDVRKADDADDNEDDARQALQSNAFTGEYESPKGHQQRRDPARDGIGPRETRSLIRTHEKEFVANVTGD